MDILVVSRGVHVQEAIVRGLGDCYTVKVYGGLERTRLCQEIASTTVAITTGLGLPRKFLNEEVLDSATNLKLIQQFGVATEVMDVAAAQARGIWVSTLPQGNSVAVAELGLFLIFCLCKEINLVRKALQKGAIATPLCAEVSSKKFCIVGLGNIGTALAARLRALGGEIIGVSRLHRAGAAKSVGVSKLYPPKDLLLAIRNVDYVVLCLRLTEKTKNLIGEKELQAMGPSARLINLARGDVVNRESLEKAIFSGNFAGYATDVGWQEPIDFGEPLWQQDNVVVTPHIGATTRETNDLNLKLVRENIQRIENGMVPLFVVAKDDVGGFDMGSDEQW